MSFWRSLLRTRNMSRPQNADERTPLIADNPHTSYTPTLESLPEYQQIAQSDTSSTIKRCLYTSHFLSTWNSRVFEFGAVLYLASIYNGTLLPMSVYALSRGIAAILFAPAIGHYIDVGNRLQVVRVSIGMLHLSCHWRLMNLLTYLHDYLVLQRVVVAISCTIFYLLATSMSLKGATEKGALAVLALLACVEKLCSIMNLVSVERDWVRLNLRLSKDQ